MQDQQTTMFLQSLRGNQALIALTFLLMRRALTLEDLEACTGLNNDTVRKAVKGLASKGLLFQQRGEHGRQTWIPIGGTFFAQVFDQNPKTSDSGAIVVNVESEEMQLLYSTSLTDSSQNPKTSDSTGEPAYWKYLPKPIEEIRQCLALLRGAGIVGKKAKDIAEDHHITAGAIKAHLAWVKSEDWERPLGMMIYRLENHVEPPELNEVGHVTDCRCDECRGMRQAKRYTDSPFAGSLNRGEGGEESEE